MSTVYVGTCSEEINIAKPCVHTDEQRASEEAWVTPLLHQATEDEYFALQISEAHYFPKRDRYDPITKSGGIIAKFILALTCKIVVTSGFPFHVKTDH